MNSLSFYLDRSLFILHFQKTVLLNIIFLAGNVFFSMLKTTLHAYFACKISVEKFPNHLIAAPLYMINHFSFAGFKILSLSVTFEFYYNVSWCGPLCIHPICCPLNFLNLGVHSLPHLGIFQSLFQIISVFLSLSFLLPGFPSYMYWPIW